VSRWRGVRQAPGKGTLLTKISEGMETESLPSPTAAKCEVSSKNKSGGAAVTGCSCSSPVSEASMTLRSRHPHQ
jgi:hypothetical protein